jgi:hypothetical protein
VKHTIAGAFAGAFLFMHLGHAAETFPEALRTCVSLRRDVERLACYDRVVASIEKGEATTATTSPENMFGASSAMTPKAKSSREGEPEELMQISGQVVSVGLTASGLVELALDNDQVWRQQDSDTVLSIKTGDSVTISRASLGTFRITDKRGRSARFKRVR